LISTSSSALSNYSQKKRWEGDIRAAGQAPRIRERKGGRGLRTRRPRGQGGKNGRNRRRYLLGELLVPGVLALESHF